MSATGQAQEPALDPRPLVWSTKRMASEDQVFLEDGNVTVTRTRFQVGADMYPVAGLTAVSTLKLPKNYMPAIVCFIGAALALLSGLSSLGRIDVVPWAAFLGFTLLAIVFVVISKAKWAVSIATAGGQRNAIISEDRAFVEKVVKALTQAIAARG